VSAVLVCLVRLIVWFGLVSKTINDFLANQKQKLTDLCEYLGKEVHTVEETSVLDGECKIGREQHKVIVQKVNHTDSSLNLGSKLADNDGDNDQGDTVVDEDGANSSIK